MTPRTADFNEYWLSVLVVLSFVGVGMLSSLGYIMGGNASSNFTKIHPTSYLLMVFSCLNIFKTSNTAVITRHYLANKAEYRLLLLILCIFIYLYITNNLSSVSFIIDTLLCPVLLALNFYYYPERLKWKARKLAVQLILLNSYVAIGERILSFNVFPITKTYGDVFRSTALLGHPLNNALITLVFVLYVVSIGIPIKRKMYIIMVLLTALVCFGARGSLYISILAILILLIRPAFVSRNLYFRKVNRAYILMFIGFMGVSLAYLILNTTLGERLVQASFYDSSADVRAQVLNLISFENLGDYLFAKSQNKIDIMNHQAGIEIIENFFIVWILKFGLVISLLLVWCLYKMFYTKIPIKRIFERNLIIALFFIAAATNNSLATSTQTLSIFIILFCLFRQKSVVENKSFKYRMPKSYV